jgi:hypothetical protein
LDFCKWRAEVELPLPTRESFIWNIAEAGFQILGGYFVGLAFKENWTDER